MDTLLSWLETLGLEHYAHLLESHGVDLRSLPLLTDRDLADLGMLLGHRKLLLKAAAHLNNDPREPVATALAASQAERRQLTVLFCDLVGSTGLAQRLDPEALRDLMTRYQQTCGQIASRYGGHVAQYRGDGMEVYFGWPQAHEDDAERAVRAALEMVDGVGRMSVPERLQVRVGIATGLVVVGTDEHTGRAGDASVPSSAIGETPNLAARLQGIARPDQVVIAPATHRLLGRTFDVEDLGDQELKGIGGRIRPLRIRRLARSDSRFDAIRAERITPFVGREHEVDLLMARWGQVCEGEGQAVLLCGEPGIGKSRISQVLGERLAGTPHLRLQYQCSPYHVGSAFFPLIERIERAAGFERDDGVEKKLDKLEAMLDLGSEELPLIAPLFAALLSLPAHRYPPRMLSPQKHMALTIDALVDHSIRLARAQPVLMVFEDAHWMDPSTRETTAVMVERIRSVPILLLVTCRPDFVPAWNNQGNVSKLDMNRLSRRHGTAMAVSLAGGKELPGEVLSQILERADGVPLFVEELTKTVLDLGILHDAGDRWGLNRPLPPLAIPSTLQDSLTARLDRLAPIKEVAQIGACIGREFDHGLLSAVARMSGRNVEDALEGLVSSGLILRQGSTADATYRFKHALVQDVAYDGLLRSRRQQIHERIAHALAHEFKDRAKDQPELLALHLTRAGLIDLALSQWRTAAVTAIANHRHREALGHVDAGLALVDHALAERRANHEVALLAAGAACHWVLTGYACQPAADLLARAEALLDGVTDQRLLVLALGGILIGAYVRGETPKAISSGERLASIGQASTNTDTKIITFSLASTILAHHGEFDRAQRLLEFVIENYEIDRRFAYGRINDPMVHALVWLSWMHSTTGRLDQARHNARLAVEHATTIGEPFALSQALSVGALAFAEAGDCEEALRLCRRCMELCEAQNMPNWRTWAIVHEGVALSALGEHERAQECFARAIAHMTDAANRNNLGFLHARLARELAVLGRFDEARRTHDAGHAECLQTGQLLMLNELNFARGVIELLDPGSSAGLGEHWLTVAMSEASINGMRLIELRSAAALAGLWRRQHKVDAAHALIQSALDRLGDVGDCTDLRDANTLLRELRHPKLPDEEQIDPPTLS